MSVPHVQVQLPGPKSLAVPSGLSPGLLGKFPRPDPLSLGSHAWVHGLEEKSSEVRRKMDAHMAECRVMVKCIVIYLNA